MCVCMCVCACAHVCVLLYVRACAHVCVLLYVCACVWVVYVHLDTISLVFTKKMPTPGLFIDSLSLIVMHLHVIFGDPQLYNLWNSVWLQRWLQVNYENLHVLGFIQYFA